MCVSMQSKKTHSTQCAIYADHKLAEFIPCVSETIYLMFYYILCSTITQSYSLNFKEINLVYPIFFTLILFFIALLFEPHKQVDILISKNQLLHILYHA